MRTSKTIQIIACHAEGEVGDDGGRGERRADALCEPLGRPGREAGRQTEARGHDVGDEPAEGAERGTGEHPRPEPVGQHGDQPGLVSQQDDQRQGDHTTGDEAGRHLVDRVRELEQLAHAQYPTCWVRFVPDPTGQELVPNGAAGRGPRAGGRPARRHRRRGRRAPRGT